MLQQEPLSYYLPIVSQIPFNRPFVVGKELYYMAQAVTYGNIAADGHFTHRCSEFFQATFGVHRALMTASCTAALEMAAMLAGLGPGDEAILPSFTFVSTANAIARTGAKPVFVDVREDTLNIDERKIEQAITPRTKAIFPVHYAGVACEMDTIVEIARAHRLLTVEDAAQGVNARYKGRALGSIGELGCYSFHETKNYICGEGGALCINDPALVAQAEIIRDKGTNRAAFGRGEVAKYTWVGLGSSYVPAELVCAFLLAQLENLEVIARRRRHICDRYRAGLLPLERAGHLRLPITPADCEDNSHMFYVLTTDNPTRQALLTHLRSTGILAVFHYVPLHSSPVGRSYGYTASDLPITEDLSSRLIRLPLYFELSETDQDRVIDEINRFYTSR